MLNEWITGIFSYSNKLILVLEYYLFNIPHLNRSEIVYESL